MFKGRKLLIATKHEKEKIIAPLAEKTLNVKCVVSEKFDTDTFGTFTGEIERKDGPLSTVRNKCLEAMEQYDCDLGIANEGSFGPHPSLFFVSANEEILIFIDKQHKLEITARELSTETNFDEEELHSEEQLIQFAKRVQFPSHALILSNAKMIKKEMVKGITDWDHLRDSFGQMLKKYGSAYVETDMRAMFNPSRRKVIEKATHKLMEKINSCCPECDTPGFGVTEAKAGLPCYCCHSPTRSTLSYLYKCQKCAFIKEALYPHGRTTEDPGYCDICNP